MIDGLIRWCLKHAFLVMLGVVDDDSVIISTYLENIFDNATFNSVPSCGQATWPAPNRLCG